ncbi:hypothetical protein D6C91_08695 [Aureobasidium pullulans]|uniref:Uncharacterized protein n=1 Tax=Aureobasidium pullulans TaxID=5580 RepID=A0A4S9SL93_AURPU|nr:hypothetical protein D6C91_08695 [Aureobasidium pullulans]
MNTKVVPERLQEVRPLSYTRFADLVLTLSTLAAMIGSSADTDLIPDATILCTRFGHMCIAVRKAHELVGWRLERPTVVQQDGVKGLAATSVAVRTEIPLWNRAPKSLFALHLLDKFLLERFPLDGMFRSASKERKPGSMRACKPSSHWSSVLSITKILGKNLAVLRRMGTVLTHKRHGAGKIAKTSYILDPAGTSGAEVMDEPTSDDDNAGSAGQRWGIRKGVKFVDHGKRTEVPPQDRLPKRSDANWLLVEFLNQGFLDFIRRPDNAGHHYAADLKKEPDPPSIEDKAHTPPRIDVLLNNIRVYRSRT